MYDTRSNYLCMAEHVNFVRFVAGNSFVSVVKRAENCSLTKNLRGLVQISSGSYPRRV